MAVQLLSFCIKWIASEGELIYLATFSFHFRLCTVMKFSYSVYLFSFKARSLQNRTTKPSRSTSGFPAEDYFSSFFSVAHNASGRSSLSTIYKWHHVTACPRSETLGGRFSFPSLQPILPEESMFFSFPKQRLKTEFSDVHDQKVSTRCQQM